MNTRTFQNSIIICAACLAPATSFGQSQLEYRFFYDEPNGYIYNLNPQITSGIGGQNYTFSDSIRELHGAYRQAYATYFGKSSYGDVGVFAEDDLLPPLIYQVPPYNESPDFVSEMEIQAQVQVQDVIAVTSASLPTGTPVDVSFNAVLEGSLSLTGTPPTGSAEGALVSGNISAYDNASGVNGGESIVESVDEDTPSGSSGAFTLQVPVGDSVTIDYGISVSLDVQEDPDLDASSLPTATPQSAVANFYNTLLPQVTSATPDVALVSQSGFNYDRALPGTPAPAACIPFALGLLARRKKRLAGKA